MPPIGQDQVNKPRKKPRAAILLLVVSLFISLLAISALMIFMPGKKKPPATTKHEQVVAQVTITANGFEPAAVKLKKGTKIIWTNTDTKPRQVAANPYPTNDDLPGLKSSILNPSQKYEYTADKPGSFGYHDQLNPTNNGTLEIQE